MSKIRFIPQEWMSVPSNEPTPKGLPAPIYNKEQNSSDDIERITREMEQCGVDIAPSYSEWCNLGFALVAELGESGRSYYHRLSSQHSDYDRGNTDRQYDKCLQSNGHGITIRTFFHMARTAGISISASSIQNGKMDKWQNESVTREEIAILPNCQDGKNESKWINDEEELPTFPEEVYSNLPPLLKECVDNSISREDRAAILLGAIACLSSCFPNVMGIYDERHVYPNLYFFLVANAGMGKGSLTLTRELVAPIDRELKATSKEEYARYKEARKEYAASKNKQSLEAPEEPRQLALIIPANSSAASFHKILTDNDGNGLLFETEGDTLSNSLKTDYGNYSDALRKSFHHETISFSRRTERAFEEVAEPRLSVVLAGTPEQVRRLIPDTEDGLMSRFMFFHLPFKCEFRNVFATTDVRFSKATVFRQLGDKFKLQRDDFLRRGKFHFSIGGIEQAQFLDYFKETNKECCEEIDKKTQGVVCRMGLIAFRIMMLFTTLRELGKYVPRDRDDTIATRLVCGTEDFETAMMIIDTLAKHTVFEYVRLSNKPSQELGWEPQRSSEMRRMTLYNILPDEFNKGVYSEKVRLLGLNSSTTDKWLPWFIKRGLLEDNGWGGYKKVNPEEAPQSKESKT